MAYDPEKHHRRSIRLKGYDYASPGAYFVTICVQDRECVLGEVVDDCMQVTECGRVAHSFWGEVPVHFPNVSVDVFVVMPNHVHAIIVINDVSQAGKGGETPPLQPGGEADRRGAVTAPDGGGSVVEDEGVGMQAGKGGETPPLQRWGVADCGGAPDAAPATTIARPTLGQIVAYYKYQTTKYVNQMGGTPGTRFWQRNYWEHIIRNETSYRRIYEYVEHNPALWEEDQLHPDAPPNPFNRG